jgi:hypothetical protein
MSNNGGPAFPRPAGDYNGTKHGNGAQDGMSLRDYFAAKAMQGLLQKAYSKMTYEGESAALAHEAYRIANAMLKARDSQKKE